MPVVLRRPVASRRQSRYRGPVTGGVQLTLGGRLREGLQGVGPTRGEEQQVGPQRRPRRRLRQPRKPRQPGGISGGVLGGAGPGGLVEGGDQAGAGLLEVLLDGEVEAVEVAGGGLPEAGGRRGGLATQGGGRAGGVVVGEHPLQQVDRGLRVGHLGVDEAVRVAVADDLEVDVVLGAAAGEHRVELLAGFLAGGEAVHGVGGDALGGVDGGGVAQLGGGLDVGSWEADGAAVLGVLHGQPAPICWVVQGQDGPAVAVLDPVGRRGPQPAVVGSGDDQLPDRGLVAVREPPRRHEISGTGRGARRRGVVVRRWPGRRGGGRGRAG